jgi:hypothetical protein
LKIIDKEADLKINFQWSLAFRLWRIDKPGKVDRIDSGILISIIFLIIVKTVNQ